MTPPHVKIFYLRRELSGAQVRTTNRGQLEQTLKELRRLGRIEKIHAAAVQALRSMAFALDADPANAALWKQYREALRELTADDDGDAIGDALDDLFAEVRDETPA
jgi:hypothetical protein